MVKIRFKNGVNIQKFRNYKKRLFINWKSRMKFIKCSASSDLWTKPDLWTNFNGIKNPQIGYVTYVKDFTENANFISYENLLYNNNFYPQYSEGEPFCNFRNRKFTK